MEFTYTIRADMGDHYEDIKTGRMFGSSKIDIESQLKEIYGKGSDLIFIVNPL